MLVPELERLVAEDALHEEYWRLLALSLYRSSRQADALAALRRARDVLADELGVDPGPALRQMESDVLAQAPSLELPEAPVATAAPVVARGTSLPDLGLLVDREDEVARLASAIGTAALGKGEFVVIEGPAGIGKTRLMAEARRLAAASGLLVLDARASQLEHEYGFGVVRQLLELTVEELGGGQYLADVAPSAAAVFDTGEASSGGTDSFTLLQGLIRLVSALTKDRPLMLTVDDLQYADISSMRFLSFLQRRIETLPVLVVATLRTGETHAGEDLLAEVLGDPSTTLVRPGALSEEAAAEVVRERLGKEAAAAFIAACHRATQGNPLLLLQLLRALETENVPPDAAHAETVTAIGSRAIWSMVKLRLRRLPENATSVARAVAVLGDRAELATTSVLTGLPEQEVVTAVAALARAEILRGDYPLGFVHPLVEEAVYGLLAPGERETAHERAAQILEGSGATAEHVAVHLLQSPKRGSAAVVQVLVRAADTAESRGAPEAAATFLARAIDEPAPQEAMIPLLMRLAMLAGSWDGPLARRSLERAYALATDPEERAEIALVLTGALVFLADEGEATAFAIGAAEELPDDAVDTRQALTAIARISGWIHHLPPEMWLGEHPLEIVESGFGSCALTIEQAWELCVRGIDRERAVQMVHQAMRDTSLYADGNDIFNDMAGIALMTAGVDTRTHWDAAMARDRARGELITVGIHLWRGVSLWRAGNLREGQQSVLTARHQTEEWGSDRVGIPLCDAFLVLMALDLGDTARARALLDGALPRPGIGVGRALLREAQSAVLLAEGDAGSALAVLDRWAPDVRGLDNPAWITSRLRRAEVMVALARGTQAHAILETELLRARQWGAPLTIGVVLRRMAETAEHKDRERYAREAVEQLELTHATLELARALDVLATVTEDEAERVTLWTRVVSLSDGCGCEELRVRAAARLVEAGAAVPAAPPPEDTLTELERRSLSLVAEGLDVDEAARDLFVTARTVEVALESARQRLDAK